MWLFSNVPFRPYPSRHTLPCYIDQQGVLLWQKAPHRKIYTPVIQNRFHSSHCKTWHINLVTVFLALLYRFKQQTNCIPQSQEVEA